MHIELIQLRIVDGYDIYDMLQEIPQNENGYINNVNGMTFNDFKEWLIKDNSLSQNKELIDGWKVPSSTYWLYIDGRPVGVGRIRHFLTDKLREEGGHIGYSIRPSERNKGYGTILLKKLLTEANNIGIDDVLLTIRNENVYSIKVALANKGIIEKRNDMRCFVWIESKKSNNLNSN